LTEHLFGKEARLTGLGHHVNSAFKSILEMTQSATT
jgi:hypothetical protein